jgi:hypothetical protein
MAAAHLKQILEDLEFPVADDKLRKPGQIFNDKKSAFDISASFKGTSKTYAEEISLCEGRS